MTTCQILSYSIPIGEHVGPYHCKALCQAEDFVDFDASMQPVMAIRLHSVNIGSHEQQHRLSSCPCLLCSTIMNDLFHNFKLPGPATNHATLSNF
jgi:hypothetical protein